MSAIPATATLGHITSALIQQFAGVEMTHVPYRGSAPLITDLLGGQVNVAMDFMPTYLPAGGRRARSARWR